MRPLSVADTLKHIYTPHCLFCGQKVSERSELVFHISQCKAYSEYRHDAASARTERNEQARRADEAVSELRRADEKINSLEKKLKALEALKDQTSKQETPETES